MKKILIRLILANILSCLLFTYTQAQKNILGMVAPLENDSLLYASGFRLTGTTVESTIGLGLSEEDFQKKVEEIKRMKCNVYMCNVLFPGSLKIAGPDVDEKKVLAYLEKILIRAQKAGIKNLVLGSGGARRLPEGYDKAKAVEQFSLLARKMGAVAKKYRINIILENLNSTETNFINTLSTAAEIVRKANHPNLQLNADIYHMLKENESPEEIIKAGKLIVYCEIAEKEKRSLPGMEKEDFRPYLKALKKINYDGPIVIEGRSDNLKKDVPPSFQYLMAQLREVYKSN